MFEEAKTVFKTNSNKTLSTNETHNRGHNTDRSHPYSDLST